MAAQKTEDHSIVWFSSSGLWFLFFLDISRLKVILNVMSWSKGFEVDDQFDEGDVDEGDVDVDYGEGDDEAEGM